MAYQGFISGDTYEDVKVPIHSFYDLGFEMIIAQSFSKIMGLYGERAAPLHIITQDASNCDAIKAQLGEIALGLYLTPLGHGARIIKTVLGDENLRQEWTEELKVLVNRLNSVRDKLYNALIKCEAPGSWQHIKNQHGMFSFTGLDFEECEKLIKKHKIFLVKSGRISLSGLNDENIEKVALAIKDVKS